VVNAADTTRAFGLALPAGFRVAVISEPRERITALGGKGLIERARGLPLERRPQCRLKRASMIAQVAIALAAVVNGPHSA
jgi:hypothetical protein